MKTVLSVTKQATTCSISTRLPSNATHTHTHSNLIFCGFSRLPAWRIAVVVRLSTTTCQASTSATSVLWGVPFATTPGCIIRSRHMSLVVCFALPLALQNECSARCAMRLITGSSPTMASGAVNPLIPPSLLFLPIGALPCGCSYLIHRSGQVSDCSASPYYPYVFNHVPGSVYLCLCLYVFVPLSLL